MARPTVDKLVSGNLVMHDHSESDLGAILDSRYVNLTGDTMTGNLVMNGANIDLGTNYLVGEGGSSGVYVDNLGNVGIGTTLTDGKLTIGSNNSYSELVFSAGGFSNIVAKGSGLVIEQQNANLILQTRNSGSITIAPDYNTGTGSLYLGTSGNGDTTRVYGQFDVQEGNVGIGTTAPAQALDVVGKIRFRNSGDAGGVVLREFASGTALEVRNVSDSAYQPVLAGYFSAEDGSLNSPGFNFGATSGDYNTGIRRISADKVSIVTGATDRLTVDSIGNVGIGTTAPDSLLSLAFSPSSTPALKVLNKDNSNQAILQLTTASNNARLMLWDSSNNQDVQIHTGGDSWFNGGNVGIGTTSPAYKLDINGTSNTVGVRVASNTANDILFYGTGTVTGNINLLSSGISATGNTQINLSNANSTSTTANANIRVATTGSGGGDPFINFSITGQQDWAIGVDNSDSDKFKIGYSSNFNTNNVFTADTSGNVGIGTTAPNSGYKLDVVGNSRSSGYFFGDGGSFVSFNAAGSYLGNSSYGAGGGIGYSGNKTQVWAGSGMPLVLGTDGSEFVRITNTGNVGIGTTTPSAKLSIDSSLDSFPSLQTKTKQGQRVFSYLKEDGTNLWYGQYDTSNFHTYLNDRSLWFNMNGRAVRFDGGGIGSATVTISGSARLVLDSPPAGGVNLIAINDGAYATASTQLTTVRAMKIGTWAWNGSNGYSIGSQVTLNQTQLSATNNDARFDIANTNNVSLFSILTSSGNVGIGTTTPGGKLHINGTADDQQLIIEGHSTQTANLTEWQNSSGTILSAVNPSGNLSLRGSSPDSTIILNANNSTEFNTSSLVRGMAFEVKNAGSGSVWGITASAQTQYAGSVGSLYGMLVTGRTLNASTVVNNYYGINIQQPTITAGSVGNNTGLLISDINNADTLNYAIYTNAGRLHWGDDQDIAEGKNVILGTTTGTKIGTSTSQKLGFYNATPVVQQAYTAISDPPTQTEVTAIRDALINLGLMASS